MSSFVKDEAKRLIDELPDEATRQDVIKRSMFESPSSAGWRMNATGACWTR